MALQNSQRQRYSPSYSNRDEVREIGWISIAVFLIAIIIYYYVINVVVFRSQFLNSQFFRPLFEYTSGLVNPTLLAGLAGILIIGIGVILAFSRLKWEDIGIRRSLLPQAALIVLLIWVVIQLIGAAIRFATTGGLSLDRSWSQIGLLAMLGLLIGQLFGNSLFEEIAFRGFLLPQIYFKTKNQWLNQYKWTKLMIALAVSQIIFVLIHIPNRLGQGYTTSDWIIDFSSVFIIAIIFALIYLKTGNLFIAIGLHAFIDAPESLFISGDISKWFFVIFGILIIILWPRVQSRIPNKYLLDYPKL